MEVLLAHWEELRICLWARRSHFPLSNRLELRSQSFRNTRLILEGKLSSGRRPMSTWLVHALRARSLNATQVLELVVTSAGIQSFVRTAWSL